MARIMFPGSKKIDFADAKEFKKIVALRREVFCGELGEKPAFIKDARDEQGIHIAYYLGADVVACGSAYDKGGDFFELALICVKDGYRRFKVGSTIIEDLKAQQEQ